jgi:hypothetical protein
MPFNYFLNSAGKKRIQFGVLVSQKTQFTMQDRWNRPRFGFPSSYSSTQVPKTIPAFCHRNDQLSSEFLRGYRYSQLVVFLTPIRLISFPISLLSAPSIWEGNIDTIRTPYRNGVPVNIEVILGIPSLGEESVSRILNCDRFSFAKASFPSVVYDAGYATSRMPIALDCAYPSTRHTD